MEVSPMYYVCSYALARKMNGTRRRAVGNTYEKAAQLVEDRKLKFIARIVRV